MTATLESYAGPLTGGVTFREGSQMLSSAVLRNGSARFTVAAPSRGVHSLQCRVPRYIAFVLTTPRVAVTIGRAIPALLATNQKLTVVGGRTAACDQVASVRGTLQPGCEVVSSHWLPGAKVVYTISYPDGSSQAYTAIADSAGNAQHAFAVAYKPAPRTAHGDAPTVAWINLMATSRDGVRMASASLRFSVIAPEATPSVTATTRSTEARLGRDGAGRDQHGGRCMRRARPRARARARQPPLPPARRRPARPVPTTVIVPVNPNPPGPVNPNPPVPTATATTPPAPAVTGLAPTSGSLPCGTSVTITGSGFTGATAVIFGTTAATSFTVDSATQITATCPAGSAGTVEVTVTTPNGTSAASDDDQFTYLNAPTVSRLNPYQGPTAGGTVVTITGMYFTGATSVDFGSVAATTYHVDSDTQITVTSPAQASYGQVDVIVTTPGGISTVSEDCYFQYYDAPTVTQVSPSSGSTAGGTTVTITGAGFNGIAGVSFGAVPAAFFTVNSSMQITAVSPAGSGTVDVTVSNPRWHFHHQCQRSVHLP